MPEMKILIVAFWFPPANVIGALRVGKLARYLDRRGHQVHVLTTDVGDDQSSPLEIPKERIVYTDYREGGSWLDHLVRRPRGHPAAEPTGGTEPTPARGAAIGTSLRSFLGRHYRGLRHIPDTRADWIKTAVPAGRRLIKGWRPDIIFASAPPHSGFIVASRLARAFNIPWIADFRDLWVDNPYYGEPVWRRPVDAVLERLTLRNAAGLVTVSPIWAEQLRRRHGKAADVIYNGYAAEDFPELPPRADLGEVLTIRYMGSIYRGFRDPSPVFAAIGLLPDTHRNRVIVEFFCDSHDAIIAAAAAHGVTDSVVVRPRIPYRQALLLQMQADVLLLLQSNDRRDEGNLPAKLFEYLYARRPILFIGYEHGIAAQIVSDRGAGLVSNSPVQICEQLRAWIEDKQAGRLNRLDPSVCLGLGRDEQYEKLEHLFVEILSEGGSRQTARDASRKQ
jgi:glycosyltransferase involved in cell wall biosynthesis